MATMAFMEIAFQAEMDRREDEEWEEQAWLLCGEDAMTRQKNIEDLRSMIFARGECNPVRIDDAYLLRFLRARQSIPARAHRLLVRYCTFREQHPELWRDVDWFSLSRLGNIYEGVLFDRPDVGRIIIGRIGLWNPDETPVVELLQGMLALLEIGILCPRLQVLGGNALLDCEGLTMKHMRYLTPAVVQQAINIMGISFPLNLRGVHVINCSKVFETLFYWFKRIMPADDLWRKVYFHGYDLNSLHRYLSPDCLPKRYGGSRQEVSLKQWLTKIKQYKNKEFDEDMRTLGYSTDSSIHTEFPVIFSRETDSFRSNDIMIE